MLGYLSFGILGITACAVLYRLFVPAMSLSVWLTELMMNGFFRGLF